MGEVMSGLAAWIESFIKAQGEFPAIGKGSTVNTGTFSYRYAALPDILDAVSEILRHHGFAVLQSVGGTAEAVEVETRIYHKDGHVERFGPLTLTSGRDPKAAGSAITYARRYALCAALGIAPDEDDDGTAASRPPEAEPKPLTPWAWLWGELAVFKGWTDDQRMEAVAVARDSLAIGDPNVMSREDADRMFAHIKGQYEQRDEQGALPVD